jgi:hypothetical protein
LSLFQINTNPVIFFLVEYKCVSSLDPTCYANRVLPNAVNQIKEYERNLLRIGFPVKGKYLIAAKQLDR